LVLNHDSGRLHQKLYQRIYSESPTHHDVIQYLLWIEVKSLADLADAFWSESILSVDVKNLALAATL